MVPFLFFCVVKAAKAGELPVAIRRAAIVRPPGKLIFSHHHSNWRGCPSLYFVSGIDSYSCYFDDDSGRLESGNSDRKRHGSETNL